MKTGSFLLALVLAAASLNAQAPAGPASPDSARAGAALTAPPTITNAADAAAATAAGISSAEVRHGTATPTDHASASGEECAGGDEADYITPHITDSHCIDLPSSWKIWEAREHALPRWAPVHVGGYAIDLSPTKHVVMLLIAAVLLCAVMILTAGAHARHSHALGRPKGFSTGIEAMVLFIRQEVALPNLGPHGEAFVPFILTLFFFILTANLLGLLPYMSTATGNISVTATLAILTFFVVEVAGMRAQGAGYLGTIFYWNKDLPLPMRVLMLVIMTPVEFFGKLTKPFALTIRLFANMTAGHIVVLALIGLIFAFKSYAIGVVPAAMAVAIMFLELFVAFLQAYIFALLASVFIGQIRESHH